MSDKIRAVLIFEMLGKPAEYVNEMLSSHTEKLEREKGIKIVERKISNPKGVENSDLFSSFVEVEVEIDDLPRFMNVLFAYMPCHVDVLSPDSVKINNFDLGSFGNELVRRLHEYDSIAKIAQINNAKLAEQLMAIQKKINPNFNVPEVKGKKARKTSKKKR